ncbi:MAG: hypothetical protein E7773_00765 [Sphingomonas sp.]|uniref:hypothetical protein n=1 Tax=Sphingomonas sp. TaxID=28214 RepID=UPI0012228AE6|nr:hypothetical protein [Sphingomonas sp.]THD38318.1 MAG: hypothetical protein E7773_00765 [Sphingomonas sp.]
MELLSDQSPAARMIAQRCAVGDPHRPPSIMKRPSKITVPERASPLAKLVFAEMKRQGVTYADLEWGAGVQITTFKAWRSDNRPGLETIEAALGALGWALVPVPNLNMLAPEDRAAVEELAGRLRPSEILASAIQAAADFPARAARDRADRLVPPKRQTESVE